MPDNPKREYTAWSWLENDACLYGSPMLLWGLAVTAGAATATISLYAGRDTSAPLLATIKAAAGTTRSIRFGHPVFLDNGLYVDLDANTVGVGVQWEPTKEPVPE